MNPVGCWSHRKNIGTFTAFVFTTIDATYQWLSKLLSEKLDVSYSETSALVKPRISFSLLGTLVTYTRESRSRKHYEQTDQNIDFETTNNLVAIG